MEVKKSRELWVPGWRRLSSEERLCRFLALGRGRGWKGMWHLHGKRLGSDLLPGPWWPLPGVLHSLVRAGLAWRGGARGRWTQ